MPSRRETTKRARWTLPTALALALHAAALVALVRVGPLVPDVRADEEPPVIDVVFAAPEEAAPSLFTEQPEDRADVPPEDPRHLSNVDSRPRDGAPGGEEDAAPRLTGESEVVAVAIPEGDADAADAVDAAEEIDATLPTEAEATDETPPRADRVRPDAGAVRVPPSSLGRRADAPRERRRGDLAQVALFDPGANTSLAGSVSLSTTEWAYAEWMEAFRRDFLPNWRPPSGWRWQLVFGRTRLALHIGRDGTLRELEIKGEEGHKVLHDASVRAVERTAPFRPLPEDFPDEELVLGLELVYPRVRR